ncbi:acyl-CoA dehydrogenase family protein [Planomonospora parontospora]|uniref:acyl-CoA dehydrogenase family protein n=1 Tax=Planomonospora parontospora TaxID=58119 RepID=UPI0016704DA8|nr:acyl-CoA dehydrogenase family protein [Planomonospora parontospora]GGL15073.1 putative acyl-CoA dehydrogenase [Planomonospora parontospora subsp. antibiotica]GII15909.1 putative acyl-CoA dehydrogenase [Planomonospora parontospora subsp. antibiotica]
MDFTLGEELEAVRDLAREVFADRAATERVRAVEGSPDRIDEDLWTELAKTGLLGVALPEEYGGAGLGPAALCVLLEEQGRRVAPVPVWPALVGALAVAAHGTAEQRRDLLPGIADGSARLTVALEEFGPHDPRTPECTARPDGSADGGWRLTGVKAVVPSPSGAAHVLVSATAENGTGLFLVDTGADRAGWERVETTSRDLAGNLLLTGAAAQAVGRPGTGAVDRTVELASVALAALQLGVAEGALRLAAGHLAAREQFGRPLATFQAVQHQLADCYIEIDAMRVCLWRAVCAIEEESEAAAAPVAVAQWWAAEAGLNVVHRVQHVHGGIGVDVDYPVHRHFLWGRQIAGTLGGASAVLARLGDALADGRAAS